MSQSNDSGLNLDWLSVARKHGYAFPTARMEYFATELIALARRAALANQPAPTVPDDDTILQIAANEMGHWGIPDSFVIDFVHKLFKHQPVQEQAENIEADAYMFACDEMERWQKKRAKAGLEIGTEGSLVDGIGWLYAYIEKLEAAQQEPVAAPQQPEAPKGGA